MNTKYSLASTAALIADPARAAMLAALLDGRSLPSGEFPALTALGQHVWAGNRDQRFTAGLDTILAGLQAAREAGPPLAGHQPPPA